MNFSFFVVVVVIFVNVVEYGTKSSSNPSTRSSDFLLRPLPYDVPYSNFFYTEIPAVAKITPTAKVLDDDDDFFPMPDADMDSDDDEGIPLAIPCPETPDKKASKNSYLASLKKKGTKFDEPNEDCTNFKLINTVSYFESHDMQQMCVVILSVPSGLYLYTLEDIVTPSVAKDGMSLIIRCEWPGVVTDCSIISRGFAEELNPLTLSNMVHAINKENLSLKSKTGLKPDQKLGGISVVKLNFEVERKAVRIQPLMCMDTNGVMLAVILRKLVVQTEVEEPLNKMRKLHKDQSMGRASAFTPREKF